MPSLYRINIKPGGSKDPMQSFNYCLEQGVLGVGWGVGELTEPVAWDTYWEKAKAEAGPRWGGKIPKQVQYIHQHIRPDDLIWTREPGGNGNYYLGRVTGTWEYRYTEKGRQLDIFNVIPCRIYAVQSLSQVPGEVENSFSIGGTICATGSRATLEYTKWLWNQLSGDDESGRYPAPRLGGARVWDFLTPDQIEDVVFLYLQEKGWRVVPKSRKVGKPGFEYFLIDSNGKTAKAQVKAAKGKALYPSEYRRRAGNTDHDHIFLFHAMGAGYESDQAEGVTGIEPAALEKFMIDNVSMMPSPIAYWINNLLVPQKTS